MLEEGILLAVSRPTVIQPHLYDLDIASYSDRM